MENVMDGGNGSPVFRLRLGVTCVEIPEDAIAGNDDQIEGFEFRSRRETCAFS